MSYDPFIATKLQRGLGNYNGTREEWRSAYRMARNRKKMGLDVDASKDGVEWKAQLVIFNERNRLVFLDLSTAQRYRMIKTTDEIFSELERLE